MIDPATFGKRDTSPRFRPLLRTTLGDVLRRTRLEQGRTLADVARFARVSMPYISELERGRKEASSEVLAAICDALGIELADLLAEVRHELIHARDRRPAVLRLDGIRDHRIPARNDVEPDSADVLRSPAGPPQGPADAPRASASAQCLLAA